MINRTQEDVMKNWPKEWDKPMVSVRCLAYNHEKYIRETLDGFMMQETNFPFEVIVHDDASTDRTVEIIREYEAKFPKIIKPIYETENQFSKGNGTLRRIVNEACKGEYIAYCEGDDYWCDKYKLQRQFDALNNHQGCTLCTHVVQQVSENGSILQQQHPQKDLFNSEIIEQETFAEALIAKQSYPFQTSSFFLRASLIRENNNFFDFPGNGDEKIMRLCLNYGKTYFINEVMSCYRIQSVGSWSYRCKKDKKIRLKSLSSLLELEEQFDKYSHYRFHNFIEISKRKTRIQLLILTNRFKDLFLPEYKDFVKQYYSKKTFIKFYILSKLPFFVANRIMNFRRQLK